MAKTVPGRRVVVAEHDIQDPLGKRFYKEPLPTIQKSDFEAPATVVPERTIKLTYKERLERRLRMADMALDKYERRLESGRTEDELTLEEERLFLAHVDSVRKLETTLASLEAKDNAVEEKSNLDLALDMIERGMALADVLRVFGNNPILTSELQEALDAKQ
jgi:predicted ribosome quality control (RQC) complex YloA/Tae2 family protein